MNRTSRRKCAKRIAQASVALGGFFAVAGSNLGFAQMYENGSTNTEVICGIPITTPTNGYNGNGYGEGHGEGTTTITSTECNPAALLAFLNANFISMANFFSNISHYMEMFRTGFGSSLPPIAYKPGAPTFQVAARGDTAGMAPAGNRPLFLAQAPSPVGGGSKFGVWVYGTGVFGHVAADGAAPGYRHTTGGFLAGFDWQTDRWMVGAHAGYAGTNIRVRDDGSRVSISHIILGVHGALRWEAGPYNTWYVDGIFNVGILDHDVTQSLTLLGFPGTLATGGPNGLSFGGKIEAGTILRHWGFEFNPYASLQVVHLHTNSFTLTSPATNVAVSSVDTTSVRLRFAAQAGKRWQFEDGSSFKLNVRLGWVGELADTRQNAAVSALGGTVTFNARSNSVGRSFALLGANAHYQMGRGFGVLFDYKVETNNRSTTHALLGGFRYTW